MMNERMVFSSARYRTWIITGQRHAATHQYSYKIHADKVFTRTAYAVAVTLD